MTDLAMLPAHELARLFKTRKASPVEATRAALARIERFNPKLNALQHIDPDGAMKAARAAEKRWKKGGKPASPIDGVPITIKDMVLTRGLPTRMGSMATNGAGPWLDDAPSAARLREAGTVLLGKTTSPEYGWKGVTDSALFGATHNPWKLGRTPGGSSGGGVACEAVGIGNLAVGTDGAGSVRIPCSFTGLFGLKPTHARVPLHPPSAQGTLSNAGPMTRTVRDAALMMNVIARPDGRDPYSNPRDNTEDYLKGLDKGVKGLRIAYSPALGFVERDKIDRDVAVAVDKAARHFRKLGAKVTEASPDFVGLDPRRILNAHWQSNVALLVKTFPPERRALMDPGLLRAAEVGESLGQEAVVRAIQQRQTVSAILTRFMADYDLLLTPTMPMTAFAVNENAAWGGDGVDIGWTPFTLTFNLTRQPAATIPCGLDREGLPIGLQIVGNLYADDLVLRAAGAFERDHPIAPPPMALA
ncbi:MAG: amidase [Alphaproteobacteria bacterium]|nr:amidase [Alphaproteobacteria bacterium]